MSGHEGAATPREPELWQCVIGPADGEFRWMVYRSLTDTRWFSDEDEARNDYAVAFDAYRAAALARPEGRASGAAPANTDTPPEEA